VAACKDTSPRCYDRCRERDELAVVGLGDEPPLLRRGVARRIEHDEVEALLLARGLREPREHVFAYERVVAPERETSQLETPASALERRERGVDAHGTRCPAQRSDDAEGTGISKQVCHGPSPCVLAERAAVEALVEEDSGRKPITQA